MIFSSIHKAVTFPKYDEEKNGIYTNLSLGEYRFQSNLIVNSKDKLAFISCTSGFNFLQQADEKPREYLVVAFKEQRAKRKY